MNWRQSLTNSRTKPRTKPRLVESKIQSDIVKAARTLARVHPCLVWLHAIPNGGSRNYFEAIRLKREGVTPGIADLFLPEPLIDHEGHIEYCGLYMEVKTEKGRLSPHQKAFRDFCEKRKYKYVVVRSAREGVKELTNYLGGQNGEKRTTSKNLSQHR